MKNGFLSVAFIAAICICSCTPKIQNQRSCAAAPASDTVIFSPNKPVALFTPCRKGMEATLTTISDSRCPKGVECVWAGTVSVEIKLNDGFLLKLDLNKETAIVHESRNYTFMLADVTPYPGTGTASPAAIIKIKERLAMAQ